ncbi:unnamed protein product [Fraxinus pennsylvanica]|uniref:Uncharacterized protein n=1 Tax=Fraxinus pennsylvanica TaxID=56036 RepID=A0AAD1ZBK6_9LAMI|nr:unnamed protein product [Fraxinus pennsylvanica]
MNLSEDIEVTGIDEIENDGVNWMFAFLEFVYDPKCQVKKAADAAENSPAQQVPYQLSSPCIYSELGDAKSLVKAAPPRMHGNNRGKVESRPSIEDNKVSKTSEEKKLLFWGLNMKRITVNSILVVNMDDEVNQAREFRCSPKSDREMHQGNTKTCLQSMECLAGSKKDLLIDTRRKHIVGKIMFSYQARQLDFPGGIVR